MKKDNTTTSRLHQRRLLLKAMGGATLLGGLGLSGRSIAKEQQPFGAKDGVLDVVVIGAGLSGLTTARDLLSAGCESFMVLEARNRVGGRTYNHDLGNGVISEAGGQWIGPGQTAIADLARELDVKTFPTYYEGKAVYMAGTALVKHDTAGGPGFDLKLVDKLDNLSRKVPSKEPWTAPDAVELDKLSVGDWLAREGVGLVDRASFNASMSLSFGSTPAGMGLLHYLSIINTSDNSLEKLEGIKDGAQETRLVGGSQILSIRMAEILGDRVKLSSPVRRIVGWDRDIVDLHTDQGIVRARQVVMAINPALCNQIAFEPALPEGRAELQRRWPAYAPLRKTVHVYDKPFWRSAGLNGQVVQTDGPIIFAYDNSPPNASVGVINAFVRSGSLPSNADAARDVLSAIYAKAFGDEALHPTQFHDQDWGKVDQWSLTCLSPIPPGFWTAWGRYLKPAIGRLIWSGAETADFWAGAMDGAVRAGHHSALQALNALTREGRPA